MIGDGRETASSDNVVTNFLAKKGSSQPSLALGKLAVSQSNYFLIGGASIKKALFDQSLSRSKLDAGYKKIMKPISANLSTKDRALETLLHSKLALKISQIFNRVLMRPSVIKATLRASAFIAFLYIFYTMVATNLYPNPLVVLSTVAVCLVFSSVRELLSKLR